MGEMESVKIVFYCQWDSVMSQEGDMRILFIWENCHMFDGKRAFWVEVPLETFRSDIQGFVPATNTCEGNMDEYLEMAERFADIFPDTIKKNHVCQFSN